MVGEILRTLSHHYARLLKCGGWHYVSRAIKTDTKYDEVDSVGVRNTTTHTTYKHFDKTKKHNIFQQTYADIQPTSSLAEQEFRVL